MERRQALDDAGDVLLGRQKRSPEVQAALGLPEARARDDDDAAALQELEAVEPVGGLVLARRGLGGGARDGDAGACVCGVGVEGVFCGRLLLEGRATAAPRRAGVCCKAVARARGGWRGRGQHPSRKASPPIKRPFTNPLSATPPRSSPGERVQRALRGVAAHALEAVEAGDERLGAARQRLEHAVALGNVLLGLNFEFELV